MRNVFFFGRPLLFSVFIALAVSGCASKATRDEAGATPTSGAGGASAQPSAGAAGSSSVSGSADTAASERAAAERSVYYAFDQYEIGAGDRSVIEANARYLRTHPQTKVRIEGNADERGSREYNLALGQRRAEAVVRSLTVLGIPAKRLEAVSYGEEKPRATGHDEASWAQNRRGDFVYKE